MDNISLQNVYKLGNILDCTLGQLSNKGGEEIHEIKWSRDKREIDNEII